VVVLAALFYEWTARTSVRGPSHSWYYRLADSFLHLHTYLLVKVPASLEALAVALACGDHRGTLVRIGRGVEVSVHAARPPGPELLSPRPVSCHPVPFCVAGVPTI
jgi:hypothetical protein